LGLALDWIPDIFHAHDWHAALVPYFLQQIRKTDSCFRKSRSILNIHNAGYQGRIPGYLKSWLKIDDSDFYPDCFEDFGGVYFLKGGMLSADQVNMVSPGYAEELKTPLRRAWAASFLSAFGARFFRHPQRLWLRTVESGD
jgi:Glycogen synthase